MNFKEFAAKPLTSNEDALAAIKESAFEEVCTYICDGDDSRVMRLLNALWISRQSFTREQILEAIVRALFPGNGYMRCAASATAIGLAKAAGCEADLQRIVQDRWPTIDERGCNELVLGLSSCADPAAWFPVLPLLFESNDSNEV